MKKLTFYVLALAVFASCDSAETTHNADDDDSFTGSKVEMLIDALEEAEDTTTVATDSTSHEKH